MGVHQVAGPLEPFSGKIVSASEQSVDPFIMHSVRPFGAIQVRNSKLQKQVAQGSRIENRCVQEGRESPQSLVSHPKLLSLRCKLAQYLAPFRVDRLFVVQHIFETNTAMGSHHAEW